MAFIMSDGADILKKKITSTRISKECLQVNMEMIDVKIKIEENSKAICREKAALTDQLLDLFEKMKTGTSQEMMNQVYLLYQHLNELDTIVSPYVRNHMSLVAQYEELEKTMNRYKSGIAYVESNIPDEKEITVYKIKPKYDEEGCDGLSRRY